MRILSLRRLAMAGALSVAGLSLVGMGTNAVFTAQTTSNQQITAGTVSVAISSPSSPGCASASDGCQSLTLPPVGPTTSTFTTTDQTITVTNTGNIPLNELDLSFGVTNSGSDLATQAYVCLGTTGTVPGGPFSQISDDPLAGLVGASSIHSGTPLMVPGSTYTFLVNVYAGSETTACGAESVAPLTGDATTENVTLTSSFTFQG
jgi:predicted ribosomally synthesized peptide with SipW-like signal peptide